MGMINIARLNGIKMMEEEPCVTEAACFNCQKLLEDKRECSLPGPTIFFLMSLAEVLIKHRRSNTIFLMF